MKTETNCDRDGHRMRGTWGDPTPATCADCDAMMPTDTTPSLLDRLDPRWPVAERYYRATMRSSARVGELDLIASAYRCLQRCREDTIISAAATGQLTEGECHLPSVKAAVRRYADREFDVFGRHTDFARRALQATGQEQG